MSCLTLSCQLERLALKVASNGGPSVVAGAALMGSLVDFQSQHHDSPSVLLLRFSLCVAEKRWRVYLKTGSGNGQGVQFHPAFGQHLLPMLSTTNPSHILVQGFDAESGPCCHHWVRVVATSQVSRS